MFNEKNTFKSTINENIKMQTVTYDGQETPLFKNLKDYEGKSVRVVGFYIRETKYGLQATVQSADGVFINLPKHMTETFQNFTDGEIDSILGGHLMLTNIKVKYNKKWNNEMCVCKLEDC